MAAREPKSCFVEDSTVALNPETLLPREKSLGSPSPPPESHNLLSSMPAWVSGPLQSPRAWKVLLRCWIATLASFIILAQSISAHHRGDGLFCAPDKPVATPISSRAAHDLRASLLSTLVAGLLSGWGIGIGAMRAANAVRNQALIKAAGQQIQASIKANPVFQANPALAQTTIVFSGWFLDVRSTVIYGAFLAIGTFIFGAMRTYVPKLIFMSIFGTIALDVFCAVGPLFPSKRYTLLNSMAISVGCYMAIVIVTTLLIFPETMSHAALDTVAGQLQRIAQLIQMQDAILGARPEELTRDGALIRKLKALRAKVIGTQQQLTATSGFLSLEFTFGKWSGDDVRSLEAPFVTLITRVGCLLNFDRLIGSTQAATATQAAALDNAPGPMHDTYLFRQIGTRNATREAAHGVRPEDILPILNAATTELRVASAAALSAVRDTVELVNTTRWGRARARETTCSQALEAASSQLRAALAAFETTGQSALLAPFLPVMQAAGPGPDAQADGPLRALFVAYAFAANMLGIARGVLALVDVVSGLDKARIKSRLWAPTGLRSLWGLLVARGDKTDGAFGEDTSAPVPTVQESRDYRRDPDSRPPTNASQKVMHRIHKIYQWAGTAEAVFIFKYVFISIALWLPAVFQHSAHFYYVEKGIGALIMAQTTLNIYAADQIFNYATRLLGTPVGLAVGLLAWYAGNGKGNGNPYGSSVAVGVCIIPLLFVRIFAPERFLAGNILCCTTFALVVGYSWIDGHAVQFASPGIGCSVAWKRWALVMAGAAASFILMMFPPKSGRKAHAGASTPGPTPWMANFRTTLMGLADEMQAILSPSSKGRSDISKTSGGPRSSTLHSSKVLNPNFISDVMAAFTLVSQSLRTGEPLHHVLPHSLLDRLSCHHGHARARAATAVDSQRDLQAIKAPSYMYYASGMISVYQLLESLDELHVITKEMCGEIPLGGFVSWREEYQRNHSV
ncbi:hypothetical protein B0H19DRAFT_1263119 [Mycena capillaripes]|nr:hypothetical protein B0H19DRAFT_1263119 [Mycena capillaripes]